MPGSPMRPMSPASKRARRESDAGSAASSSDAPPWDVPAPRRSDVGGRGGLWGPPARAPYTRTSEPLDRVALAAARTESLIRQRNQETVAASQRGRGGRRAAFDGSEPPAQQAKGGALSAAALTTSMALLATMEQSMEVGPMSSRIIPYPHLFDNPHGLGGAGWLLGRNPQRMVCMPCAGGSCGSGLVGPAGSAEEVL